MVSPQPPGVQGQPLAKKPPVPEILWWGVALYVLSFGLGMVAGLVGEPPRLTDEEKVRIVVAYCCFGLPLLVVDLVGMVVACLGYVWGAVLRICVLGLSLLMLLAAFIVEPSLVAQPLSLFSTLVGIGSVVCFVVPPAWEYYRACEAYRRSQSRHY